MGDFKIFDNVLWRSFMDFGIPPEGKFFFFMREFFTDFGPSVFIISLAGTHFRNS